MSNGSEIFKQHHQIALYIFMFSCSWPALEANGFGFGIPISLSGALIFSVFGGLVSGILAFRKPLAAGIVGGLLAGPLNILALHYYVQNRTAIWSVEIALVLIIASIPGLLVALFLRKILLKK